MVLTPSWDRDPLSGTQNADDNDARRPIQWPNVYLGRNQAPRLVDLTRRGPSCLAAPRLGGVGRMHFISSAAHAARHGTKVPQNKEAPWLPPNQILS